MKKNKITNLIEAEQAVNELLQLEARIDVATAAANKKISDAHAEYMKAIDGATKRALDVRNALQAFATKNRYKGIFPSDSKSVSFLAGSFGFADNPDAIGVQEGVTESDVIDRLLRYNYPDIVRPGKPTLDKNAAKRLNDAQLEIVGLQREESETFFIEINTVEEK